MTDQVEAMAVSTVADTGSPEQVLPVEFEGPGAGIGELSWGQREVWHVVEVRKTWLPIGVVVRLPAGTTVDRALTDLRFVMNRYPSMRTRLRFDPDQPPKQVVSASGQISLAIVDAADDEDPAQVAERIKDQYAERGYDFATDWPLRMAVIRHRDVLTHRVWVLCHLASDAFGMLAIATELADPDSVDETGTPPLEQARWQQSPAGQRRCAAALRHWESVLRRVSPRRFPATTETPSPRYREARFDSPAMHLAVRTIAARTGNGMSSVLLTVFAVALARITGINPVVVVLVVNNRFRPGLAATVSPIMQPALCVVNLPDATVDQAVSATQRQAITAYKYGYHDPPQREELIDRVNRERGEEVDLECSLNDRRLVSRDETGPPPSPARVRAALSRTTFEWTQQQDHRPFNKLYVTVEDVPDTLRLTVTIDAHHFAPQALRACLQGMEEVAVAAALDPSTRTRIPATTEPPSR